MIDFNKIDIVHIGVVAVVSAGALFITGHCAALASIIAAYALPKLGYEEIFGVSVIKISKYAMHTTYVCFAVTALITLAIASVLIYIGPVGCGGDEYDFE